MNIYVTESRYIKQSNAKESVQVQCVYHNDKDGSDLLGIITEIPDSIKPWVFLPNISKLSKVWLTTASSFNSLIADIKEQINK